jgi:hypothetical protein
MGKLESFVFELVTANTSPTSEAGYGTLVGLITLQGVIILNKAEIH